MLLGLKPIPSSIGDEGIAGRGAAASVYLFKSKAAMLTYFARAQNGARWVNLASFGR
jgi:hypothetical protein